MTPLAIVLTLREYHYPYLSAGVVLGAYSVGMAVSAPFAGRLMDRTGLARVLIPCAVAYAIGAGSLIVLATFQASVIALSACALITGTMFPRVTAALRGLWPSLISSASLREQAYNLDSTLAEIGPIVGTLLVVLVANAARPSMALLASAGFAIVGTVGFVTSSTSRRQHVPRGNRRTQNPFGLAGIRALLLASAAMGGISGALDVAAPVFAESHGARFAAGFALSASALGSLIAGVAFYPRLENIPLPARYRRVLTIQFLAFCLPLLAGSNVALVVLLFVAGAPFSLAYGTASSLVSAISPPGARTEAFAMMSSALGVGASLGAAFTGFMAHQGGPVAALGTATCFAAVALITAIPGLQRRYGLDPV
jgi:MFS family permease